MHDQSGTGEGAFDAHGRVRAVALAVAVAVAVLAGPVHAGKVYRCGETFSDTPCGSTAEVVRQTPPIAATDAVRVLPEALCITQLPKYFAFKDPDSLKISSLGYATTTVIPHRDTKVMAKVYVLEVNAKNSYGAYTGAETYRCYTSMDDSRVLTILEPRASFVE
jgi:hypothetical protein